MIRVFIVEDEEAPYRRLNALLLKKGEFNIVACAKTLADAKLKIGKYSFDLLFLDVELPDGNCFDLLRSIEKVDFKIVFTTAHAKYAVEAFKFSALHFLLKPIVEDEFDEAIKRYEREKLKSETEQLMTLLENEEVDSTTAKKIALPVSNGYLFESIDNIMAFEADGNHSIVHLKNGTKKQVFDSLKHYQELLENGVFFRCHKSFLIQLSKVQRISTQSGSKVVEMGICNFPVSVRKTTELKNKLLDLNT